PAEAQAYEVLLGSFAEPGNARVASDRLDRAMHPALAGRRIVIRSQTVNGRVFAAVTVGGFGTASQAETFCAGVRKIPLECVIKRTGALAQTPRIQPSSARAVSASSAPRP
ncbi:MAG TPA: SPOR domain-containing protein, partial [Caulobacteraceae bacterium]